MCQETLYYKNLVANWSVRVIYDRMEQQEGKPCLGFYLLPPTPIYQRHLSHSHTHTPTAVQLSKQPF